ncbi:hypothetical protein [Nonomuraea fuscirosea]|uniref:hypothetical protein n=1 Tax=Nonomuraea fuscirosea TaxID=1291556 RepID=UPI003433788F
MNERHERLGRLLADAATRLGPGPPWLVLGTVPLDRPPAGPGPAAGSGLAEESSLAGGEELRRWVRRHVDAWPAPIGIAAEPPELHPGRIVFTPPRHPGRPAGTYSCELRADGSALGAVQVGTLRESPSDGGEVWAIGEGALAWLTIALLRLLTSYATYATYSTGQETRSGGAVVEATVIPATGDGRVVPMEVWNHDGGAYGRAGVRRLAAAGTARRPVDLAACSSPALTATARPLVLDLLRRFGLSESRHIDPAGVLRRGHFTGHDELIHTWADAIGIPSEP